MFCCANNISFPYCGHLKYIFCWLLTLGNFWAQELQRSSGSAAAVPGWYRCGQNTVPGIRAQDSPNQPTFLLQLPILKTRGTVTAHRARQKLGLKEARYMYPLLQARGSTWERFEVREDRWWAFPLQLSHLLSLHRALCFTVGDSHSLCFYFILASSDFLLQMRMYNGIMSFISENRSYQCFVRWTSPIMLFASPPAKVTH